MTYSNQLEENGNTIHYNWDQINTDGFIKKFVTTEVEYMIKINKIMEVEIAINTMINLAKEKGKYKKGDKVTRVAEHLDFSHTIISVVESDIQTSKHELLWNM